VAAAMVRIAQSAMSASGAAFRQVGLMLSRNFQSLSGLAVAGRFHYYWLCLKMGDARKRQFPWGK